VTNVKVFMVAFSQRCEARPKEKGPHFCFHRRITKNRSLPSSLIPPSRLPVADVAHNRQRPASCLESSLRYYRLGFALRELLGEKRCPARGPCRRSYGLARQHRDDRRIFCNVRPRISQACPRSIPAAEHLCRDARRVCAENAERTSLRTAQARRARRGRPQPKHFPFACTLVFHPDDAGGTGLPVRNQERVTGSAPASQWHPVCFRASPREQAVRKRFAA
jgi:hypothetical protein